MLVAMALSPYRAFTVLSVAGFDGSGFENS